MRVFQAYHNLLTPVPIRVDPEVEPGTIVFARKGNNKKRRKTADRKKKLKPRKPGVTDSLDATLILCNQNDNIKEKVMEVGKKQSKKYLKFHPIITCPCDTEGLPKKFYVMIDHFYLEVSTFVHAVDLFIQSFSVFDVLYPPEAEKLCLCLAEMFYNIDSGNATVQNFIKDLMFEKKQIDAED